MTGKRIDAGQWEIYRVNRKGGASKERSAKAAGISEASVYRYEHSAEKAIITVGNKQQYVRIKEAPEPVAYENLCDEARLAWNDFGYFQRRYFGRIATPWQKEAAEQVVGWLASPEKEYVVVNAPPGCGKSTTFTLDIPAWVTVRNRAIRGQIGSKVETSAARYVQRLKRALERRHPLVAEAEDRARGLALDSEATLCQDYGIFRPENKELWSADAFVVVQHGGVLIDEKEPTWSAYGMDSGFLGMRYDFVVWDDLVDKLVLRTVESRERQQEWWDDVAEKRLEPAGLLLLQGQRMGGDDLYRYALDKRVAPDDDDSEEGEDDTQTQSSAKYSHVVFRAHYDDRCTGDHRKDAAYYPDGCLLDPRRLTWRELKSEMANKRNNYAVIYQQEDVDPETVLVDPIFVTGGTDPHTREHYPGCLDKERGLCEIPSGLFGTLLSVATADPSPTKYWSVQWWAVRCVDGQPQERYLMDMVRQAMDSPSFLDWSNPTQTFTGLMQEWQQRSVDLGLPITTWVVEANAAQRFMLQYEHMKRWLSTHRVQLIPHQTQRNKSDNEYGVQTLRNLYKYGQVRLPYKHPAYRAVDQLIQEVTHWPEYRTDDCVMAQWFLEWQLPRIMPAQKTLPTFKRPTWLTGTDTYRRREGIYSA